MWMYVYIYTRVAPKVIPSILLHCSMLAEADTGGYDSRGWTFQWILHYICCCVTDDSRGIVWQNGVWHGSAPEAKVWDSVALWRKDGTRWHSRTLSECLWRPNRWCEHSEAVGGAFQQWWRQQWVSSAGAGFYGCGMQAPVHCWQKKCIANDGYYVEK